MTVSIEANSRIAERSKLVESMLDECNRQKETEREIFLAALATFKTNFAKTTSLLESQNESIFKYEGQLERQQSELESAEEERAVLKVQVSNLQKEATRLGLRLSQAVQDANTLRDVVAALRSEKVALLHSLNNLEALRPSAQVVHPIASREADQINAPVSTSSCNSMDDISRCKRTHPSPTQHETQRPDNDGDHELKGEKQTSPFHSDPDAAKKRRTEGKYRSDGEEEILLPANADHEDAEMTEEQALSTKVAPTEHQVNLSTHSDSQHCQQEEEDQQGPPSSGVDFTHVCSVAETPSHDPRTEVSSPARAKEGDVEVEKENHPPRLVHQDLKNQTTSTGAQEKERLPAVRKETQTYAAKLEQAGSLSLEIDSI